VAPMGSALVAGWGGGSGCALRLETGATARTPRAPTAPGGQGGACPHFGKNHLGPALRPFRRLHDPSPMGYRALPDPVQRILGFENTVCTPRQLLAKDSGGSKKQKKGVDSLWRNGYSLPRKTLRQFGAGG
jgi:hypothetical protein